MIQQESEGSGIKAFWDLEELYQSFASYGERLSILSTSERVLRGQFTEEEVAENSHHEKIMQSVKLFRKIPKHDWERALSKLNIRIKSMG